jgi:DNA-binding NtrC family response regulator
VDDNRFVRDAIYFSLKRAHHFVECADDGLQALRILESTGSFFQTLITDHDMPNLNGLDLVRYVKEHGRSLNVIVISGNLTAALAEDYRKLGVQKILEKPFLPSVIVEAVNQLP